MINLIVATDEEYGIGKENSIPWKYPEDMAWFKTCTLNSTVIMGRKTFDSIGNPLKNRDNIVISRTRYGLVNNVSFIRFNEFINYRYHCNHDYFVIGGAKIYDMFLERDLVHKIFITRIPGKYNCDTFFPAKYFDNFQKYEQVRLDTLLVDKYVRKIHR